MNMNMKITSKKLFTAVLIMVLSVCMILPGCSPKENAADIDEELSKQEIIGTVTACGMIFGSPLYIGYDSDFGDALNGKASVAESYSDEIGEEKIWIYSPGGISTVAIVPVSYDDGEWIAHGQKLSMPLKSDEILEFITLIPEGAYPNEAIVCYSEDMETQYAYAIGWNGEAGGVDAYLIEITGVGEAWYSRD